MIESKTDLSDLSGRFTRQLPLLGEDSGKILGEKTVLLCGLGGVGGHVLEALARAGVGRFILVDCDVFEVSNLNRQLLCTADALGTDKVLAGEKRVKAINPSAEVKALKIFLDGEKIPALLSENRINCIVDAIDNVSA
ncbi:MAG: ThiF family adenylyltransferase [Clostridia bacterium]|nr:ThiF family adenylyltransferase [Clostridia bacterium]